MISPDLPITKSSENPWDLDTMVANWSKNQKSSNLQMEQVKTNVFIVVFYLFILVNPHVLGHIPILYVFYMDSYSHTETLKNLFCHLLTLDKSHEINVYWTFWNLFFMNITNNHWFPPLDGREFDGIQNEKHHY